MPGARDSSVFARGVGTLLSRPRVTCSPDAIVADVGRLMSHGSVVVAGPGGAPIGIVTDSDLRSRVVAARRDAATTRVREIMSSPLVTIEPDALAFEALLEMTRREIHHLVVVDAGRLAGVLSSDDVLLARAQHPVVLARDIARAATPAILAERAAEVTELVGGLVEDGVGAGEIARLVAELNDRIVQRILEQAEAELAAHGLRPPVPYGWLLFGSEGRREQTLRTDQDNGLVYADPPPDLEEPAAAYFARLAGEVVSRLVGVGFPPCPGGAMASNPQWCQPLAVWRGYFQEWMAHPTPAHVLAASMYFDLRAVAGAAELGGSLAALVREEAPQRRHFLTAMARDVVDRRLPLGLLGGVRTPRRGPHRGALDLKGAGAMQLVGAGRVHALELGLAETGTTERFRRAGERGLYAADVVSEIADAYQDLLRLRLVHQLACLRDGRPPDNHVVLATLAHRDRVLLDAALASVQRVQHGLRERFATDFAG